MLLNRNLVKHPTKNDLFIETHRDRQIGHSLKSGGHLFYFSSKSINVSENLSFRRPMISNGRPSPLDEGEIEIGDVRINTYESIFIELECSHPYSYIGSDRKIERYTMQIDDLSGRDLKSPHIEVVAHYDHEDGDDIILGVRLYVEHTHSFD